MAPSPRPLRPAALTLLLALVLAVASPARATHPFTTAEPPYLTPQSAGVLVQPIISSGDQYHGFTFEGLPDGIGLMPGSTPGTVEAFVTHEQSHVPFQDQADFQDASVSQLSLNAAAQVVGASVPLGPEEGFIRFCSAFMAGPAEGFSSYTFFANEESNDVIPVPTGAPYGPDPSLAPNRQAGYAVAMDAATGDHTQIAGMGRHNHENTVVVPGGWDGIAAISGDDTFNAPASQLYLYLAKNERALRGDRGSLWAFQVTGTDAGHVDPADPFNGANDYGDIAVGDDWRGRFIRVPKDIARGTTEEAPQTALENWSNANNVFQFIRIEDTAYDRNDPTVVYLADTAERRAIANPATGRLQRGSSSTFGPYPNGRIFRMVFDPDEPRRVTSFSILLDNDAGGYNNAAVMHQPDNMDTTESSLMVQEDSAQAPNSRVWRYDFATETWTVVAAVNDPDWESSGIVDASDFYGPGTWLLDVQAHGDFVTSQQVGSVLYRQEKGQLLLMTVPGS